MNTCLDEGMLQAYMDGELPTAQMEAARAHLAACATCAELAHEAEHEYAFFSTALAPLVNVPAPTAALRARIDDAIADLHAPRFVPEPTPARLRTWWSNFFAALTPRHAIAFASFLLAIALTITLSMLRPQPRHDGEVARNDEKIAQPIPSPTETSPTESHVVEPPAPVPTVQDVQPPIDERSGERGKSPRLPRVQNTRNYITPNVATGSMTAPVNNNKPAALLPDEKHYLTTIATLDAAIKAQGQQALTPTLRAEFERNLALVDEAIIATRVAARRNPQDADVKEFLRAAYQNKVNLLTTVADQTQYIAARD
jgi:anti-sigma factor RsiW